MNTESRPLEKKNDDLIDYLAKDIQIIKAVFAIIPAQVYYASIFFKELIRLKKRSVLFTTKVRRRRK